MAAEVIDVTADDPLVSVHVPVVFDGKELKLESQPEQRALNVSDFLNVYLKSGRLDLSPPYQRDEAWSMARERQFIASCFSEAMAIPPFYLCKKTPKQNCHSYYALDCRQRATALRNFTNDVFRIRLAFTHGSGSVRHRMLYWSEICGDEECGALQEAFLRRSLEVRVFSYLPLDTQRKVFSGLNNGVPLSADEQTYCNNFLARRVLGHLFGDIFHPLSELLQPRVRHGRRFAHIRTVHELLILCGDHDLRGLPEARRLRKGDRMDSAKAVHEYLGGSGFSYDDGVDSPVLEGLGVAGRVPVLRSLAEVLSSAYRADSKLGRQDENPDRDIHGRNVIDPMAFLYKVVTEGRATVPALKRRVGDVGAWLKLYYTRKPELSLNQSTSDLKVMAAKFKEMDLLFKKQFGA